MEYGVVQSESGFVNVRCRRVTLKFLGNMISTSFRFSVRHNTCAESLFFFKHVRLSKLWFVGIRKMWDFYEGWNFNFGNTPLDWIQELLE